jgi:hypothetical protein
MAITNGYCTLAEFKAWNTIDTTNATDDTVIEDIIESVSREIDGICGRVFYVTSATARYFQADSGGTDLLFVDDISASTSFTIVSDDDGDGVYENTWASTDYNLAPYNQAESWPFMMIETAPQGNYSFSTQKRGNKITALWGWAAVPDDVKTACLIGVDAEYHARNGQNLSVDAQVSAMGVVMTPRGLPKSAREKLKKYIKLT